jgi:hypothetical protein
LGALFAARTRPSGELAVTFYRINQAPETIFARDGTAAWRRAVNLLARRDQLHDDDRLEV